MGLEDKFSDILQNIEAAIVMVYKTEPTMQDAQVDKALETLEGYYRALSKKREPKAPEGLDEISREVYDMIIKVLNIRMAQGGMKRASEIQKRRFGALKETVFEDIFLACIRKVAKSVKRHKIQGERGYLDFIINYV